MDAPGKTIAFLTTPPGRGGIAVIALAGPAAGEIVRGVFRPWKSHVEDRPGRLRLGHIVDGDRVLDEAVLCRRDGAYEINIHGGALVAHQTLELLRRSGAQIVTPPAPTAPAPGSASTVFAPAHPRWNNPAVGREMLAALPDAHTELVLCALTTQWSGGISQLAREVLSGNPGNPKSETRNPKSLSRAAEFLPVFRKLLRPPEVVVAGPPNAGKSTLVNALVGRGVSIVHDQPGTTRDYVRELAVLLGLPVRLTDTAGLWAQATGIDAEAVRRAREQAQAADLVLLCGEGGKVHAPDWLGGKPVLRLATKSDAAPPQEPYDLSICALAAESLDDLKRAILQSLGLSAIDPTAAMAFTERQANLLRQASEEPDPTPALRELLET
jgi:tRNA modification GTPase